MDLQLTTGSSTSSTSSLDTFNSASKGLNVEINPAVAELGTAGTSSTGLLEPSPMVRAYDPSRDINKLQDEAGFFAGTGAYLAEESLYRAIYDSFDEPEFSADNNFNALNAFRADKAAASLSPDFQEELLGAVSQEDYNHRWKRIKDKQIAQRAMGEAPTGAFVGGAIDADLVLGMGVSKGVRVLSLSTQLGRGQAMLAGAAMGGATVGGVSAATGYRSNEQIMWDAVSGAAGGLLDGFGAVPKAAKRLPELPVPGSTTQELISTAGKRHVVSAEEQVLILNKQLSTIQQDLDYFTQEVKNAKAADDAATLEWTQEHLKMLQDEYDNLASTRGNIKPIDTVVGAVPDEFKDATAAYFTKTKGWVGLYLDEDTSTIVAKNLEGDTVSELSRELNFAANQMTDLSWRHQGIQSAMHSIMYGLDSTWNAVSKSEQTLTKQGAALFDYLKSDAYQEFLKTEPVVWAKDFDKVPTDTVHTSSKPTLDTADTAIKPKSRLASILPAKVVDAIDKFNTGFKGYVASYDKLRNYVGDELANKLLANPVDDVSESAVAYGRSTLLEADRALVGLERAIRAEVPQWRSLRPSTRAAARAETQELGREARQWLNRAQQMEANGITPTPHPNPRVQRIVDAYVKGDFGNIMGKAAQNAGVFGADVLTPSKYYVPVRHAYLKMQQFVESSKGSWTDLHKMYGQQIARIYPRLVMPEAQGGFGLSAEAIGKKFVYTQKLRQADPKAQAFRGTTQDELAQVLRAEGIEEGKIRGLLSTLQPKAAEAGKQKNLRHRMDWDYSATFVGSKGKVISINDFMDDDLLGNLQTYARSMSGRIGLARMGFTHDLDLDKALGEALDKLPAAERPQAQAFFNNVRAQLLGQPVGEQAPDWFRTATSYGASVQLGNSGAYAIADYAQLVHEFGITKVAKHFIGAMSNVVKPGNMTKAQAETLRDVISGQLIAEGRVRPYVTHLEDNWTGPAGSIHELAQYGGQYVRFLNGSEFVRRHQINILAGIMDDLVTQAGAGNAKAVKYFKSVGMSDADLLAMQQQVQKHGTLMDNWDTTVRARSMNAITSAGDNVVMTIRHGEQPAFVEHSAIGRVLFPYMRYVFGATQKILRRNYQRGSATGIALYMSAAVPLSTMSGMLSNIIQGRDPKEDLVVRTIRALPAMGLASLLADGFIQGSVGGAAPAFAGPNNLFSIADKAKRGELTVEDVLKAVPGANTFLPTRMLVNSINEDD